MKETHRSLRSIISAIQLRRITTSVAYLPEIDGIRFLAIFSVILFHVVTYIAERSPAEHRAALSSSLAFWIANHLSFGVQAFFVLSGFVLALPFSPAPICQARQHQPETILFAPADPARAAIRACADLFLCPQHDARTRIIWSSAAASAGEHLLSAQPYLMGGRAILKRLRGRWKSRSSSISWRH